MADDDNKKAEKEPPLEQAPFEINDADSEVFGEIEVSVSRNR